MNPIRPPDVPKLRPTLDPAGPKMADVITRLHADRSLSATRKRDLLSAIGRLCELINRDPATLAADVQTVGAALAQIHPVQAGISAKTLQSIKSNVLTALRHTLGADWKTSRRQKLCPAWQSLWDTLPSKRYRAGLSQVIRFCSANGIMPDEVSDETVTVFMEAVRAETFTPKPNDVHKRTTRLWNEAGEEIVIWPKNTLSVPDFRKPRWTTPIADFPKAFRDEVEKHLCWLSGKDLFADHLPPRPCKPRTAHQRELAAVGGKIERMLRAIEDGMYTPTMKDHMLALETRKAELERDLRQPPSQERLRLHPRLADIYAKKIASLEEALEDPQTGQEAAEIIRSTIDRIVLTPVADELTAELYGDLAEILAICEEPKSKRPSKEEGRQLSVVAGAGFEPATFRL